jgi:class 3 adenylate cyclase
MTTLPVTSPAAAAIPWARYLRVVLLVLVPPVLVFAILQSNPHINHSLVLPVQHFFVVTNVALLAAGVALLVARAALRIDQHRVLLIALGFMSLAGLFAVHGIATPGVMSTVGDSYYGSTAPSAPGRYDYNGTVIGLSAYLSLFVPSLFFAAAYRRRMERSQPHRRVSDTVVIIVVALLVAYSALAVWKPQILTDLPLSQQSNAYYLAALSMTLFVFAASRQMETYTKTRLPMHGALVIAFLFLALAQLIMVAATFWTLAWWEYHLLMFAAVVLALGALFLELDRRRGLERFLPAEVVERVVSGDLLRLAGERRVVTVMFADLRGSTKLAEQLPAEELLTTVNEYVGVLAHCVFAHGGMLDKFLGDGLMAIFGVVPDTSDGAVPAARAALQMRDEIARTNAAHVARGLPPVGFGVGLNTGEVILGAVGIPQRSEFTAIGDAVNTASRLQELTKEFDCDVVLSSQTAERLKTAGLGLRDLGAAPVRGKAQPVEILTLE